MPTTEVEQGNACGYITVRANGTTHQPVRSGESVLQGIVLYRNYCVLPYNHAGNHSYRT